MKGELIYIPEPNLSFGPNRELEDPRDGIYIFGPLDEGQVYGIRAGVIGTKDGLRRYSEWVKKIQSPVLPPKLTTSRPPFPGFEAAFGIPWNTLPAVSLEVPSSDVVAATHLEDGHQRVYATVSLYSDRIIKALSEEDVTPHIWFVIIPDDVKKYCRPKGIVEPELRIKSTGLPERYAKELRIWPSMFEEENELAKPYYYEIHFHNQLKARLLEYKAPTQVIRESTIAHSEFLKPSGVPIRNLTPQLSDIAWHLSTAAFYKSSGRPWKIAGIREGVCYIGIVFKQDTRFKDRRYACCAAQMFLDSGDGIVFKGDVGPWYNEESKEYHLDRNAAKDLVGIAVRTYKEKMNQEPAELFLHGKIAFAEEEWLGFKSGAGSQTNVVGIRIKGEKDIKLYSPGTHAILRGLAYVVNDTTAYLWTKGLIPRLQTYPGREVPLPLRIDICQGKASIDVVLNDILALTKLNYNACRHSDGTPVTLKFANAVGEILTAGPIDKVPPLQFKHYI